MYMYMYKYLFLPSVSDIIFASDIQTMDNGCTTGQLYTV